MNIEQYIKPELLILVPVLFIIGKMIKSTNLINDKWIPAILGILGMIFSVIYCVLNTAFCKESIFSSLVQGILCAGTAVYSNQLVKQLEKK